MGLSAYEYQAMLKAKITNYIIYHILPLFILILFDIKRALKYII